MTTPRPPDWKKTFEDLLRERRDVSVNDDEFHWAIDYERSLLPPDTVFPCGNQVWEVMQDCEVRFIAGFSERPVEAYRARLSAGERVRIRATGEARPIFVNFVPLRYHELAQSIVPEDIRTSSGYVGYWLDAKTGYFNEHFRLVEDAP